jgi:hypothetical protein
MEIPSRAGLAPAQEIGRKIRFLGDFEIGKPEALRLGLEFHLEGFQRLHFDRRAEGGKADGAGLDDVLAGCQAVEGELTPRIGGDEEWRAHQRDPRSRDARPGGRGNDGPADRAEPLGWRGGHRARSAVRSPETGAGRERMRISHPRRDRAGRRVAPDMPLKYDPALRPVKRIRARRHEGRHRRRHRPAIGPPLRRQHNRAGSSPAVPGVSRARRSAPGFFRSDDQEHQLPRCP